MIRTLFATTALAALMSGVALAQTTITVAPEPTVGQQVDKALDAAGNAVNNAGNAIKDAAGNAATATENAVNSAATAVSDATRPIWDIATGYPVAAADHPASKIIGAPVYSGTAEDAEQVGTISDLILTPDGSIGAVVIGVGGFLGIGEKSVAADFRGLELTVAADNTTRWVLPTTAEALEAAPEFVWPEAWTTR